MTYEISKDFTFSAAHHLLGLAADHPCMRVHGHNYVVRLTFLEDTLDDHGFVIDYNDLDPFKQWIDEHLDHRDLNVTLHQPTAEHLASLLWSVARKLFEGYTMTVSVSETPKTWATYG